MNQSLEVCRGTNLSHLCSIGFQITEEIQGLWRRRARTLAGGAGFGVHFFSCPDSL